MFSGRCVRMYDGVLVLIVFTGYRVDASSCMLRDFSDGMYIFLVVFPFSVFLGVVTGT